MRQVTTRSNDVANWPNVSPRPPAPVPAHAPRAAVPERQPRDVPGRGRRVAGPVRRRRERGERAARPAVPPRARARRRRRARHDRGDDQRDQVQLPKVRVASCVRVRAVLTPTGRSGTAIRASRERINGLLAASHQGFPPVPDDFAATGVSLRPTFFGCDPARSPPEWPLVIYIPNAPPVNGVDPVTK